MALRQNARTGARITLVRRSTNPSTRFASTLDSPPVVVRPPILNSGFRSALTASALVLGTGLFVAYYYDSRSAIHRWIIPPLMRATLDPEVSHRLAVRILGTPFAPRDQGVDDDVLKCKIWDIHMPSPIGLAAGFDKDGEAIDGLFNLGFDWVEIGSVTPKSQPGNPKPRVFNLPEDDALINRYGFPSQGHSLMLARLRTRSSKHHPNPSSSPSSPEQILAVNLGKNKSSSPDSIADYVLGVRRFGSNPQIKVLVINVSSPNTPGLRGLQNRGMLEELLDGVVRERDALSVEIGGGKGGGGERGGLMRPKIVLKIAPDLDEVAIRDVAEAVRESGVDGVIVSNTTVQRPKLLSASAKEIGGLSGPPLHPLSLKALKILRSHLPAHIPIIGCGGIFTGAEALAFARAGATSVQLYTSFGYNGVGTARRIKDELADQLKREGTTWQQVVSDAVKAHAWVKPEGQKALDEGERELRDMLDGLGKQLSIGGESNILGVEGGGKSKRLGDLKLDNETARLAELAEAAIAGASGPHDGDTLEPARLAHAPRPTALSEHTPTHGPLTNTARDGTSALEKRRSGA
ncbi:Dihydroorotate dehydrogenase (quinone), mitochondrial [Ceratobasidium sp. 395]|nr:Dihydroorotate dehydrogenase (quinone), mitochondrial [Ceratobasidium sp. 395]